MARTLEEARELIGKLSPKDKQILSDELTNQIEKEWLQESQRRLKEIELGKVECVPASEVIKNIKKRIDAKFTVSSAG